MSAARLTPRQTVTAVPDLSAVRERFPGLSRTEGGRPVVFADAPGGTQVPQSVIDAVAGYLRDWNANLGGAFATSRRSDEVVAEARQAGADLLGCEPNEVVFGQNTTSLEFHISRSVGATLRPGDEVVVTMLDHDANVSPWTQAAADAGATVRWVDVRAGDCTLDLDSLEDALSERTRVVAFTAASNALGTITPAADIVRRVHEAGALAVIDAVHFAPHGPIDVRALGVDLLFTSAYKYFGPHVGVAFGRAELLERLTPPKVRPSPDVIPDRWETGTQSHEGLAGVSAAVDYLASLAPETDAGASRRDRVNAAMDAIRIYESSLTRRFLVGLREVPGATLYGIADPERHRERTPTFALRLANRSPLEVAGELGRRGIYVWDGNYYALSIMERLGLEESGGAVRVGFCHYNTADEVDRVVHEIAAIAGA
jgi:cysteine desulfurase family protein (TIGR01976 family)